LSYPVFPVNQELYRNIRNLGGPIQFQTASSGIPGGGGLAPTGLLKDWDKPSKRLCDMVRRLLYGPLLSSEASRSFNGWNRIACVAQGAVQRRDRNDMERWDFTPAAASTLTKEFR
jgi:hypothetical protein